MVYEVTAVVAYQRVLEDTLSSCAFFDRDFSYLKSEEPSTSSMLFVLLDSPLSWIRGCMGCADIEPLNPTDPTDGLRLEVTGVSRNMGGLVTPFVLLMTAMATCLASARRLGISRGG